MLPNQPLLPEGDTNYEVMSYYQLRQSIGIIGIFLAPVLTFGAKYFGHCDIAQPSISHYYYSVMHIVFVGTLCVLGGFLITYRGKSNLENRVSNFAGLFAFGVATFPTGFAGFMGPGGASCQFISLLTSYENNAVPAVISKLHFTCAGLLFGCFVLFCLKIFQEQDTATQGGVKKQRRNTVYKVCGYIILASIVTIAGITYYDHRNGGAVWPDYIYWMEVTSLVPFGVSWLLKGSVNWPHSGNAVKRKMIAYFR